MAVSSIDHKLDHNYQIEITILDTRKPAVVISRQGIQDKPEVTLYIEENGKSFVYFNDRVHPKHRSAGANDEDVYTEIIWPKVVEDIEEISPDEIASLLEANKEKLIDKLKENQSFSYRDRNKVGKMFREVFGIELPNLIVNCPGRLSGATVEGSTPEPAWRTW